MTVHELALIKATLENMIEVRTKEGTELKMKCLAILNRELNLKTMDPRKDF